MLSTGIDAHNAAEAGLERVEALRADQQLHDLLCLDVVGEGGGVFVPARHAVIRGHLGRAQNDVVGANPIGAIGLHVGQLDQRLVLAGRKFVLGEIVDAIDAADVGDVLAVGGNVG